MPDLRPAAAVNVTEAMLLLDDVRDRLGALTVSATWETGHGDVQVTAGADGPRMTVAGQEVHLGVPAAGRSPSDDDWGDDGC
jgi:hypothetical protein